MTSQRKRFCASSSPSSTRNSGDWPQWFMLEPYSAIQDKEAHGDVIVWPLKALCDYVEATGDFAFLDEPIAWRREDNFEKTAQADPIATHVDKLIATVRRTLHPRHIADPLRERGLERFPSAGRSSEARLDGEQLDGRASLSSSFAATPKSCVAPGVRSSEAKEHDSLAATMREDFNRFLIRDGIVAGYGVFRPEGGSPELLASSKRQADGAFLFADSDDAGHHRRESSRKQQARRHLGLIRKHLLFSDGARLMDRPIAYHGGLETIFRRAESAAFFGREIGLMYVAFASALRRSHERPWRIARRCGTLSWSPIPSPSPIGWRMRRCGSATPISAAAMRLSGIAIKRAPSGRASRAGKIAVDGGWRIYSSGSGLTANMLIRHVFGAAPAFRRADRRNPACRPPRKA